MKLYLVTDRKTAEALLENRHLNYACSLYLDDIDGGLVRIPSMAWYHFPFLRDLMEEGPDENWDKWFEVVIDVPEEIARKYECPNTDGGNSIWRFPRSVIDQFLVRGCGTIGFGEE